MLSHLTIPYHRQRRPCPHCNIQINPPWGPTVFWRQATSSLRHFPAKRAAVPVLQWPIPYARAPGPVGTGQVPEDTAGQTSKRWMGKWFFQTSHIETMALIMIFAPADRARPPIPKLIKQGVGYFPPAISRSKAPLSQTAVGMLSNFYPTGTYDLHRVRI